MKRFSLTAVTVLIVAVAHFAAAQGRPQIKVLQVSPIGQSLPVQAQLAEGLLSVHYDGRLDPSRVIWVRVFRDPLDDLINKYLRNTPKDRCVVYAHTVRYRVDHGFDRELRIPDLVGFFQNDKEREQTLTLVFEEGNDPESSGPLRLEKDAVLPYFANAVQMKLIAPDEMAKQWDREKESARAAKNDAGMTGLLGRLFSLRVIKVYAAEQPQMEPPPSSSPLDPMLSKPPCQIVKLIPYSPLPTRTSLDKPSLFALAPVAEREYQNCGQ
jgi:hypothetical protein